MTNAPSCSIDDSPQSAAPADPLSDLLECLVLRTWIPGRFELTAPWGLQVATRLGWFYLPQKPCRLDVEARRVSVSAGAGDLIIVSPGREHRLRDTGHSPITPIQNLLERRHFERREPLVHGGGGAATRLFCGCFLLSGLDRSPLHTAVPAVIHIRGENQRPLPYVDHLLHLLQLEAAAEEPCAQTVMNRLVQILLLKAIRGYTSEWPESHAGWLRALADPDLGRALGLMHARPDAPWTVAALAKQAAMARSTFSARFAEMVGTPPLEYLTQWRMQKAAYLLRATRARLKEVAAQVGYDSAAAFSKAFTRWPTSRRPRETWARQRAGVRGRDVCGRCRRAAWHQRGSARGGARCRKGANEPWRNEQRDTDGVVGARCSDSVKEDNGKDENALDLAHRKRRSGTGYGRSVAADDRLHVGRNPAERTAGRVLEFAAHDNIDRRADGATRDSSPLLGIVRVCEGVG
jgi:AraC-like DNA-binding protein